MVQPVSPKEGQDNNFPILNDYDIVSMSQVDK